MKARDGYGKMRTSRKLSATSFRDKANQWKFTCEICCSVPLLYSRGSGSLPLPCRAPFMRSSEVSRSISDLAERVGIKQADCEAIATMFEAKSKPADALAWVERGLA